jgi:hypothetical protein
VLISILLAIGGLIIGLIFSYFDAKWARIAQASVIGAAVGLVIGNYFEFTRLLSAVQPYVQQYGRSMYAARQYVNDNITKQPILGIFRDQLDSLDEQLESISNGHVLVDRNDVFEMWTKLVTGSEREIVATNLVTEKDWQYFAGGDQGSRTQALAVEDGVRIRRVMVYDERAAGAQAGLRGLACRQKTIIKSNYEVREISLGEISTNTPAYLRLYQVLGTYDVVMFDDTAALLTTVGTNDHEIQGSILTVVPAQLEASRQYLTRIFSEARPIPCP